MSTVTLVGRELAAEGEEFVYRGEAPGCEGCPYRDQCLNLVEGGRYRVVSVREGGQPLDCAVHAGGEVVAVEVEPASTTVNVPTRRAYAGSKASLAGSCPHTECPSHGLCVPNGVDFDEEHRIAEVHGDPPHEECALGRDLTAVEFAPRE
jgi:uncharacterized protein (UPF0179 family)